MSDLRTPWRGVAAMFILNGALFGIWASRIPIVAETHALGAGALGALLLLMAAGAIVAFPFAGRTADSYGALPVTRFLAILYTLALFLIALAPSTTTLAAALFFFGAAHGGMDVSMNTWAGEVERRMDRPVMSSFHAMFSLGAGLGAFGGYVAAKLGLGIATHFILAGLIFAALTFPFAMIPWQSERRASETKTPMFILPKGPLLLVAIIAFCASIGEGAMADWSGIFLVTVADVSEAKAALGYTVFSVAMVVMRLAGDQVIRRLGNAKSARLAGALACTGATIAVVFGSFPFAILGFGLMGLGYAMVIPLAFSRAVRDPILSPGAAIAAVSTLGYGGMLLGPPTIGFLAEAVTLRGAFVLLALLAAVIVVLAGTLRRSQPG